MYYFCILSLVFYVHTYSYQIGKEYILITKYNFPKALRHYGINTGKDEVLSDTC